MSSLNQKTINKEIIFSGIGLHTGKNVNIKILPASPNTGIVFKRIDLNKNNEIIPGVYNVSSANFCTTISNEQNIKVSTIEHLMGAFFGLGIDNAVIEIDNEEMPILDGSAKQFVESIKLSGIKSSQAPIKIIKINKKISFIEGDKFASLEPGKTSLDIDFEIKYDNPTINTQKNTIDVYNDDLTNIYNSRTFCLFEDIKKLREMNLAMGGSLQNALVVKGKQIINPEGLRNANEFVNHKILDCIGDLYLSGYKIIGKFVSSQGGHRVTNELLRKVFQDSDNYSIIEITEKNLPHTLINKKYLKSIA